MHRVLFSGEVELRLRMVQGLLYLTNRGEAIAYTYSNQSSLLKYNDELYLLCRSLLIGYNRPNRTILSYNRTRPQAMI